MKIVLVSDSHGDYRGLQLIAQREYEADYYWHCGDCGLLPEQVRPFIAVRGNIDSAKYPLERLLTINDIRILMVHGHLHNILKKRTDLAEYAKAHDCRYVFYGHLHLPLDETIQNVRLLNPGSIRGNRDGSAGTYYVLTLTEEGLLVHKHFVYSC